MLIAVAAGGVLGLALGYVSSRGRYCLNSAFRASALRIDHTRTRIFLFAAAIQMIALPLWFALGWAQLRWSAAAIGGLVVGAVVFGIGMRWANGCATSVWYKLGRGDMGALVAAIGMGLGALLALRLLAALFAGLPGGTAPSDPPLIMRWILPVAGLALAAVLWRAPGSWRRTAIALAIIALGARAIGSHYAQMPGLTAVPAAGALSAAVLGIDFTVGAAAYAVLVGLILGGTLAGLRDGDWAVARIGPLTALSRLIGGAALGVGAVLAGGCTAGHGLMGVPLLAPASLLAIGLIFLARSAVARPDA